MARTIAQLDYAKAPNFRRQKLVRRLIWATGALLVVLAGSKFVGPAWDHLRLLHYQNRCLVHFESADKIVYEVDAKPSDGGDWGRFYAMFSPPGGRRDAVLFVHELRRPDGVKRLVAVELSLGRVQTALVRGVCCFETTVIDPAGVWSAARLRDSRSWISPLLPPPYMSSRLRLYAGQVDSSNPSHFTIDYDYGEARGTIDGWLGNDDVILFEPRAIDPVKAE